MSRRKISGDDTASGISKMLKSEKRSLLFQEFMLPASINHPSLANGSEHHEKLQFKSNSSKTVNFT